MINKHFFYVEQIESIFTPMKIKHSIFAISLTENRLI